MAKRGLHINIYRVPGSSGIWRCDLKLNTSDNGEGLTFRGTSEPPEGAAVMGSWWSWAKSKLSKAGQALSKARVLAKGVMHNPAVAAAFPEYVGPALLAMKALEVAEAGGKLSGLAKDLTDPTLKKFAREMYEMSTGKRTAMSGGGICLACDSSRRMGDDNNDANKGMPFGLPSGNPHPWAQLVRAQLARGVFGDGPGLQSPLMLQKLAAMQEYQRGMARASR